jgi:hypothetical protein
MTSPESIRRDGELNLTVASASTAATNANYLDANIPGGAAAPSQNWPVVH